MDSPKPFEPFVSPKTTMAELTPRALILGVLLGLMFGIGNAYLGLKVGTTVSASIPAAVMSMAILRLFFRRVTILENNIVQTVASVGEALAAGVIFTVPALIFLGSSPSLGRIFLLAALGGILGVLFMIPMRRYIIVQEHGKLPFPEGTACAEILKAGAGNRSNAVMAGWGILIGVFYKILMSGLHLWDEVPEKIFRISQKIAFSMDCTPSLLGVGYIVGPRVSALLFSGGVLAWWVIIPLIQMFGGNDVIYPSTTPISQMSVDALWSNYVRYIGAGGVAIGGVLSLIHIFPLVGKTLRVGFQELMHMRRTKAQPIRTDSDIPLPYLILGSVAIVLILWLFPGLPMNFLTIILMVILGFFFVAVSSLTVGIVGSTSNPTSGMTITVLLITCLLFVALGWTEKIYLVAAITVGCVVNVALAMAVATSQDLKTGFLLGATPRLQQISEIIGVILPAAAIGGTVYLLNDAYTLGSPKLPAPQATLMALIVNGVINGELPILLVLVGIVIGLILEIVRVPILPFAIGLYLPLSLSTAMMVGGIVSLIVSHYAKNLAESNDRGILMASGLIAGDACTGVVIALLAVLGWVDVNASPLLGSWVSYTVFVLLALFLILICLKKVRLRKSH